MSFGLGLLVVIGFLISPALTLIIVLYSLGYPVVATILLVMWLIAQIGSD